MRRIFPLVTIVLVVLMLACISCGDSKPDIPESWETVQSKEHGFSMRYPEGWSINNQNRELEHLLFYVSAPADSPEDMFLENVNLSQQPLPDGITTLDAYMEYLYGLTLKNFEQVETLQEEIIDFHGVEAHHSIHQFVANEMPTTLDQTVYLRNGRAYILTYGAETPRYEQYKPVADMVKASFEIK